MRDMDFAGSSQPRPEDGMEVAPESGEEASMSAVVKSWVRIFCPKCKERQTYVLQAEWRLVCSNCGHERSLRHGVLGR
jgi:hypothetical protein